MREFKTRFTTHLHQLAQAAPRFGAATLFHPEAPPLISSSLRIAIDIASIFFLHVAFSYFTTPEKPNEPTTLELYTGRLGYYFLWNISALLILRNQLRKKMHLAVLQIAFPEKFSKSHQCFVKDDVCAHCTAKRIVEGEFRTIVVFSIQNTVVDVIAATPYVGWYLSVVPYLFLYGQMIVEYRLGSDGVCDRHRTIFNLQYPELSVAIGLVQFTIARILACAILFFIPLLRADVALSCCNDFVALYMIGLLYHTHLPPVVSKSDRYTWCELTNLIRRSIAFLMDLMIPGVMKKIDLYAMKQKDRSEAKKNIFSKFATLNVIRKNAWVQRVAMVAFPQAFYNSNAFMHDPIFKLYWPCVLQKITELLRKILDSRKLITSGGTCFEIYQRYVLPAQKSAAAAGLVLTLFSPAVSTMYCASRLMSMTGRLIGLVSNIGGVKNGVEEIALKAQEKNKSMADFMGLMTGVPKGVVMLLIALLRDEAVVNALTKQLNAWRKTLQAHQTQRLALCDFPDSRRNFIKDSWENIADQNCAWPGETSSGNGGRSPRIPAATSAKIFRPEAEDDDFYDVASDPVLAQHRLQLGAHR